MKKLVVISLLFLIIGEIGSSAQKISNDSALTYSHGRLYYDGAKIGKNDVSSILGQDAYSSYTKARRNYSLGSVDLYASGVFVIVGTVFAACENHAAESKTYPITTTSGMGGFLAVTSYTAAVVTGSLGLCHKLKAKKQFSTLVDEYSSPKITMGPTPCGAGIMINF